MVWGGSAVAVAAMVQFSELGRCSSALERFNESPVYIVWHES
jgi:hypothetical protein